MRLWAGSLRGNRWTSGASDFTGEAASRGERVRDPSLLQPVAETPVLLPTRVTTHEFRPIPIRADVSSRNL